MAIDKDLLKAFEYAAELLAPIDSGFTPFDHFKVPTPLDWYLWMLFGGRGSGKTAHGAKYVHDHVHGPPCLPNVPGGHWISIVAPTLGDAVTSCVEGPTGLRAHDPGIKTLNRPGGIVARWSNGAEAKLFGAHSPEDVERFRAGGNRCFPADTLVDGVPITKIREGQKVWTRNGLRTVLANRSYGVDQLWRLTLSNGTVVRCTADHAWWVEGHGWVRTDQVWSGARMVACGHHESRATFKFGSERTGRSQRDSSSTTRTTTQPTTLSTTSNFSRMPTTGSSITPSVAQTGTAKAGRRAGPRRFSRNTPAKSAGASSWPTGQRWSADAPATKSAVQQRASAMASSTTTSALTAARRSGLDTAHLVSVVECVATEERTEVFCLTVEHDHEFFANGILTSNCLVWMEEFAAWRYMEEAYQQIRYGLRVGPRPHMVATTTPRSRKLIKELVKEAKDSPQGRVRLAVGTMYMNPYLPEDIKRELEADYGNTRMGRQELYGELLEDVENALWSGDQLDALRPKPWEVPEEYDRIAVAVDPAASENGDETGIVVGGVVYHYNVLGGIMNDMPHGWILEDCSLRGSPNDWAKRAVRAYREHSADVIVAEKNNGGDMVAAVIQGVDPTVPVKLVHASRGKTKRAEPVANLYSQFRVHHVGMFPDLEDQMVGWDPKDPDPSWSPDRMDALVWCVTELMLDTAEVRSERPKDRRLVNRR